MRLVVKAGPEAGRELALGTTPVTIGRDPAADVVLGYSRPGILMASVLDGVDVPFPLPAYLVGVNGVTLDGTLNGYCEAVAGTTDSSVTLTVYLPNTAEPLDADMPFL